MTLDLSEYSLSRSSPRLITTPPSPKSEEPLLVVHHTTSPIALTGSSSRVAYLKNGKKKRHLDDPQARDVDKVKMHKTNSNGSLNLDLLNLYLASGKPNDVKDNQYGLNLLCWACQCRSLDAVKMILQQGNVDINQNNNGLHQLTALHIAAAANFISGIDYLIQQPNLDLNQQDKTGLTALHHAARSNHYDSAKALLEAGARLDVADNNGKLALHYAIRQRNPSPNTIQLLLEKRERNNPSWINLVWSASRGHYSAIEESIAIIRNIQILHQLVRAGAFIPLEQGGWWEDVYRDKRNELMELCVHWNRFDCLQYLVEEVGIAQKADYAYCQRALHSAVQQRKLDLVVYLCKAARVRPCDLNGYNTSLLYAANHGFMEMIPYLLTADTSSDCIQQALLFAKMIGKNKHLSAILQHFKSTDTLHSLEKAAAGSEISIDVVNNAFSNIFKQIKENND
ncbi:conserved hypothetical protein [Mucor ambiguus]|uniref:Uncharacterized protein n=1 Tax=Mucor ambiguus TaxID=91626 RepID=A0A0C9MC17_9FUNG|nr:conserved hypothetical protein [Mucor ambiguus]